MRYASAGYTTLDILLSEKKIKRQVLKDLYLFMVYVMQMLVVGFPLL